MLMRSPLARHRLAPPGFIPPCRPTLAAKVPAGDGWLHELKHDGICILARKDGERVWLWSRNGRDKAGELVAIAAAMRALPFRRIVLDGEAVAHCPEGLPDFHRALSRDGKAGACLYAFDLLVLDEANLRAIELVGRRRMLQKALKKASPAIRLSEHMASSQGEAMFRHACGSSQSGSHRATPPAAAGLGSR